MGCHGQEKSRPIGPALTCELLSLVSAPVHRWSVSMNCSSQRSRNIESMTSVIDAAGGKPAFWVGLLVAAGLGALAWIASIVMVPVILHAFGA
jgi:hypothetical protein